MTLYHGIGILLHPHALHVSLFSFVVLLISFVIEFFTFLLAIKELKKYHPTAKLKYLLRHGDPVTLAVIYEDGVACL